ncbi:MAG: hypothetical protein F6K26_43970 [Moorea sp. SIO2I5]|nr:hypothetical protein [Moorena sp. SIO2I5]
MIYKLSAISIQHMCYAHATRTAVSYQLIADRCFTGWKPVPPLPSSLLPAPCSLLPKNPELYT